MTLLTAAVVALVFGVVIAWYTYFYKKRSTPYWALAFFRFAWFSMLLFALFAPEREERVVIEQPQLVALRMDTSASLKSPIEEVVQALMDFEKNASVKWVVTDFNASKDAYDELPWVYVGDGHIAGQKGQAPVGSVLLEANKLLTPRLIKTVIVPERVEIGAQFNYSTRFSAEPTVIQATFNGKSSKARTASFTAPERPGTYQLTINAEKDGVEDVVEQAIEVVPYFNSIQIIYPYPHPHIGMVTRLAQELGFTYHLLSWEEAKTQLKQLPAVVIGGGESVCAQLNARLNQPILWLDSSNELPEGRIAKIKTPEAFIAIGAPTFYRVSKRDKKKVKLEHSGINWNGRGINWYQNSLAYPETGNVFKATVKALLRDSRPDELRVSGPMRLYQNQEAEWVVSVVDNRSQTQPAVVTMNIKQNGETIDLPQPTALEGNGYAFTSSFSKAGTYTVAVEAKALGQDYNWSQELRVLPASIEQHRPFNELLWDRYSKDELWRATNLSSLQTALEQWELEGNSIERIKKTPQHTAWWYWGVFLVFASAEWALRRRTGLS